MVLLSGPFLFVSSSQAQWLGALRLFSTALFQILYSIVTALCDIHWIASHDSVILFLLQIPCG